MVSAYAATAALIDPDMRFDRPVKLVPSGAELPGRVEAVVLRNGGSKPLRLHAELLAEGSTRGEAAVAWHELAIYRAQDGQIALALRLMRAGAPEECVHRARLFASLDDAAIWLEGFDPVADIGADFDVADTAVSAVVVTLKAAVLRDRAERLDRAYRSLIGEVLFRLETEA